MLDPKPFAEMSAHTGVRPRPADFEAFWQESLTLIPDTHNYELIEQPFNIPGVRCYQLVFTAHDGSKIYARCVFPDKAKDVPVILHFHGYQSRSADWSQGVLYAQSNIGFISMDVRGQAGLSEDHYRSPDINVKGQIVRGITDRPERLAFKDIYLDAVQLFRIVSQFEVVDPERIYAYGGSQGGAIALAVAALCPTLAKLVCIYPFLADLDYVIQTRNTSEAYDELFRYFKYIDPFYLTYDHVMKNLAYIDVKNFAEMIQAKTLMVITLKDEVCYPTTQFAVYNHLECPKERIILREFGHEGLNYEINDMIYDFFTGSTITEALHANLRQMRRDKYSVDDPWDHFE